MQHLILSAPQPLEVKDQYTTKKVESIVLSTWDVEPGPPKKRKVNNESYDQEVTSSATSSSSSIQVVDLSVIPPSPQIPGTSTEAATPGQMDSKLRVRA